MTSWAARRASLRAELAALGVDGDPRLRGLALVVAALEARVGTADGYLASDAGPASDTLMAWAAPPPPPGLAAACADAVARAVAARDAMRALDGALPGQPLAVHVARRPDAAVVRNPLHHAAFVIGRHVAVAPLDGDRPTLVAALVELAHDRWQAPLAPLGATPPALVAWVSPGTWPGARHSHRAAWQPSGGPWLGIARVGERVALSTTHFVLDGFGHAWLAAQVAAALARAPALTPRDLRGGDAAVPLAQVAMPDVPLALAVRALDGIGVGAGRLAFAMGAALLDQDPRATWSPTIQVPVARAGEGADGRGRVTPALVRVARPGGVLEPYAAFAARYRAAVARERAGAGLVSRVLAAAHVVPVPRQLKRGVAGAPVRPRWLAPITEVLAGRAGASVLRLPAAWAAPPLVAASSPAVGDARGAWLATVVDGGHGAVLTVGGTGALGQGAALDAIAGTLAAVWAAGPTGPIGAR